MTSLLTRTISHTECVYTPGEADLVQTLFETFGFAVTRRPGSAFMTAHIEPTDASLLNGCMYASEELDAQRALEDALDAVCDASPAMRAAVERWNEEVRLEPERAFHIGFRCADRDDFVATIDRVRAAGEPDGALAGRVRVNGVRYPGDPGSITDTMAQAFVWTDLVGLGVRTFGQLFELQWHVPADLATDPA
jgi:hypothetical protein